MRVSVESSVKPFGFGSEVEGIVVDDAGGDVVATSIVGVVGLATGEGVGVGSGEVSCSSMAMVAYTCFRSVAGITTVVGQCGGGVGILRAVLDCEVAGAGDVGVESTVITGGAGATS